LYTNGVGRVLTLPSSLLVLLNALPQNKLRIGPKRKIIQIQRAIPKDMVMRLLQPAMTLTVSQVN